MRSGALVFLGAMGLWMGFPSVLAAEQQVQDGFSTDQILHSRYFTVYAESDINLEDLASRISVPSGVLMIVKNPSFSARAGNLEDQLDGLFLAVSSIMNIQLKKFHSEIKICRDAPSLSRVAVNLFGRPVQNRAFYVVALDTLYIDAEVVTLQVLGHEMSHAIQTHYFVVPPPEKIQEVLAGFVEYELRKYSNAPPSAGD